MVSVKLKQYKDYGISMCRITTPGTVSVTPSRSTDTAPAVTTYTVESGDCLWNIAKACYGDGSRFNEIYEANKSTIGGNPDLIYPGQVLVIPNASGTFEVQKLQPTSNDTVVGIRWKTPTTSASSETKMPEGFTPIKQTLPGADEFLKEPSPTGGLFD
jgi:LysM repeat protein